MARNRKSARNAGTRHERKTADYLAEKLGDDRIDRLPKYGAADRGDIGGLRHMGQKIAIECKDTARTNLAGWASEVEIARGNSDAGAGLIIHKRHGKGQPGDQWVTLTLADLVALLTGEPKALE